MTKRFDELIAGLATDVLEVAGELDHGTRRGIDARSAELGGCAGSAEVPEELRGLVDKIALHAYKTTDGDFAVLKDAGYSEDALFEVVVSAALGAGRARYELGMAALRGEV
jgi:alkylhydroperoxidase family enzyme